MVTLVGEDGAVISITSSPPTSTPSTHTTAKAFSFNNSPNPGDIDNGILAYPSVNLEKSQKKQDKGYKYFILTYEEVQNAKKQAAEGKERKEQKKAEQQKDLNVRKKRTGPNTG